MISRQAFMKLRRGDVILFNGRPRTVQQGPADNPYPWPTDAIVFPILRRSWTGRATTTYGYNDVKDKLSLPRRKRTFKKVCETEKQHLKKIGFNWHNEMWSEITEHEEYYQRIGLKPPKFLKMARRFIEKVDGWDV